jgi:RNA polymerase sigma factor (sigma-70 family)
MAASREISLNAGEAPASIGPPAFGFDSTRWSVVVLAQDAASPEAQEALATLCQTYWYPVYAFIRRWCGSADKAEELTQEFFTRFLEKDFVSGADQSRGSFRTYLLACCKHFLSNQRKHARAQKRGGGQRILSLDIESAQQRYVLEPADTLTPEKLFDRRWALTLLERSLEALAQEYQRQGKSALYQELKSHLVGDPRSSSYGEAAIRLEMTEPAVKKAAQRLRQRCRTIMREQILATVDSPEQLEDEVRNLFAVLRG